MPKEVKSLDEFFIRSKDYDKLVKGWEPIGKFAGEIHPIPFKLIKVLDKVMMVARPYYNPDTQALRFIVQHQEERDSKKHPYTINRPKDKTMLRNVNTVLSLSNSCDLYYTPYKGLLLEGKAITNRTILVATINDKEVLNAFLAYANQSLIEKSAATVSPTGG